MGSGTQHETSLYLYTITAIHKSKRPCTPSLLGSIRRLKRLEEDGPAVTADPSQTDGGWMEHSTQAASPTLLARIVYHCNESVLEA